MQSDSVAGGLVPFSRVAEIMAKVGQVALSPSSVWRQAQEWGGKWASNKRWPEPRRLCRLELGLKRGEVRTRHPALGGGRGWQLDPCSGRGLDRSERGYVFAVVSRPTLDEQTGDVIEQAHAEQNSYVAHLGRPEARRTVVGGGQRSGVGASDGDRVWRWGRVGLGFGRRTGILPQPPSGRLVSRDGITWDERRSRSMGKAAALPTNFPEMGNAVV